MTTAQVRDSVRQLVGIYPDTLDVADRIITIVDASEATHSLHAPTPLVTEQPAPDITSTYAHIATFDSGVRVYGTYDTDGVTPSCTYLRTNDGYFFCGTPGDLSGEWAGQQFDIPAAALPALQALFMSDMLPRLQNIAELWEGPSALETPRCKPVVLQLLCDIAGYVQRGMMRWGFGSHNKPFSDFTSFVAHTIDAVMGNSDFTWEPALEALIDSRMTPEELAERDAQLAE